MTAPFRETSHDEEQLDAILGAHLAAADRGEASSRDELLARHPHFAAELREFFEDQDEVDHLARSIARACPTSASAW